MNVWSVYAAASNASGSNHEWVIVLEDPRPSRLKGWQRSQYSNKGTYDGSLELKRYGKRVAKKYNLAISAEWFIESLGVYCLIVEFNGKQARTLEGLGKDKAVKWFQPSNNFKLQQLDKSKATDNTISPSAFQSPPELKLPESINGKGVVVAMIDSSVDRNHPEIADANISLSDLVRQKNKRSLGEKHGTAMAGIIVADRRSSMGITGVAPAVQLKAFRGCWETSVAGEPNCNTLSLARALDAVSRSKADVLNLSLSGPRDQLLDELVDKITENGTTVIASHDPDRGNNDRFPTPNQGVWIVESADQSKANEAALVFSAPGEKVVAAPNGQSDLMRGHSIATAYTSGVVALCKQIEDIYQKGICSTLDTVNNRDHDVKNLDNLVDLLVHKLEISSI